MYIKLILIINIFSILFNISMLIYNHFMVSSPIKYHFMIMNIISILLGIFIIIIPAIDEYEKKKLLEELNK